MHHTSNTEGAGAWVPDTGVPGAEGCSVRPTGPWNYAEPRLTAHSPWGRLTPGTAVDGALPGSSEARPREANHPPCLTCTISEGTNHYNERRMSASNERHSSVRVGP
ncbi:hypothetical protein Scani_03130 [Streptomyces caniferus]|uniref:Uncharacterized protein n=1 Tax=Streptomyces caniferus TaxID=285557 RepID=A0A640S342_9ACTN|nr:hypothetical protein Scani_03130 [Streptomyces caniferus]